MAAMMFLSADENLNCIDKADMISSSFAGWRMPIREVFVRATEELAAVGIRKRPERQRMKPGSKYTRLLRRRYGQRYSKPA